MKMSFDWEDRTNEFECFDTFTSRFSSELVFQGKSYPPMSFVDGVRTILDVGANCGATSLFFSVLHPEATVHSFEPGSAAFRLLERNVGGRENVRIHNIGLSDQDEELPLFGGAVGSGSASIRAGGRIDEGVELVRVRAARAWLEEHGVDAVDLLKVDTEGCEVPILTSLRHLLAGIKVVYLEYHSENDRRAIDALLGETHALMCVKGLYPTGEVTYVARHYLERADGTWAPGGFLAAALREDRAATGDPTRAARLLRT